MAGSATRVTAGPGAGAAGRSPRGRRAARPSGDDRELAILATAERLLAERPLSEISIDELARGAGISRPTFYFYFGSKGAVLLALLDRVVAQAYRASMIDTSDVSGDPGKYWRAAIAASYETFRSHRAVTLAAAQARWTSPEVRELWAGVMEAWIARTTEVIESERERAAAPPGLPARELAVTLNSMNERVMYATLTGDGPAVAESEVVDVLLTVWLNAIYQTTSPPAL